MPSSRGPPKASPLSLSRTRRYRGRSPLGEAMASSLLDVKAGEAPDHDVLLEAGDVLLDQILDRGLVVAYPQLLHQAVVLVEGVDLALHDLGDLRRRLALRFEALGVDLSLRVQHVLGNVFGIDPARLGGGDMDRQLPRQLPEVVALGHEVGLTVDLHQDADLGRGGAGAG